MTQNQQEYLISHIVDKMANYLIEDFHLDIPSALNVIYTSDTYRILSDTENDLYSQRSYTHLTRTEYCRIRRMICTAKVLRMCMNG